MRRPSLTLAVSLAVVCVASTGRADEPPSGAPGPRTVPSSLAPSSAKYQNPEMRIAGIVLTSLGIVSLATAGAVLAWASTDRDSGFAGMASLVIVMPLSAVLAAVGAPLWAVGASPPAPPAATARPSWALPSVAGGPRQATLRWTF